MTTFPGSPRLQKGALVGIDPLNPLASVIIFQYNPDLLTRTLTAQTAGGESGGRSEVMRLKGPPIETIKLDVEIDATDQMEKGVAQVGEMGIYPQLAALEMLLYPKSILTIANTVLLAVGTIEVIPPEAPFTLFIWGAKRVLPVRLNSFSITEEAHDPSLNPLRAKASLELRVLSTSDFTITHPGYALFLAHQVVKETMAMIGSASSIAATGASI